MFSLLVYLFFNGSHLYINSYKVGVCADGMALMSKFNLSFLCPEDKHIRPDLKENNEINVEHSEYKTCIAQHP